MADPRPDDDVDDDVTSPADSDLLAEIRRRHGAVSTPSTAPAAGGDHVAGEMGDDEDDDITIGADDDLIAQIRHAAATRDAQSARADLSPSAPSTPPADPAAGDVPPPPPPRGAVPPIEPDTGGERSDLGTRPEPLPPPPPPPGAAPPPAAPPPAPAGPASPPPPPNATPTPNPVESPAAPRRWSPPPRLPGAAGAPSTGGERPGGTRTGVVFAAGAVIALVIAALIYLLVLRDSGGDGDDEPVDGTVPGAVDDAGEPEGDGSESESGEPSGDEAEDGDPSSPADEQPAGDDAPQDDGGEGEGSGS